MRWREVITAHANLARCVEWSGLSVRNSHQINMHLPRPGRVAHGERERCLAKECVGSNRLGKERSQLPAAATMTKRIINKPNMPGTSSGSTTARAAPLYVSPSPYALKGRGAKSVRRRRDDSRATASWCKHKRSPPTISRNTKRREYAERYPYAIKPMETVFA